MELLNIYTYSTIIVYWLPEFKKLVYDYSLIEVDNNFTWVWSIYQQIDRQTDICTYVLHIFIKCSDCC